MSHNHQVNALIIVDPEEAKKIIVSTLTKSKMHMADAAELLGCDYVTLLRWINRLKMKPTVEKMRRVAKKEGRHHGRKGGRPPAKRSVTPG